MDAGVRVESGTETERICFGVSDNRKRSFRSITNAEGGKPEAGFLNEAGAEFRNSLLIKQMS